MVLSIVDEGHEFCVLIGLLSNLFQRSEKDEYRKHHPNLFFFLLNMPKTQGFFDFIFLFFQKHPTIVIAGQHLWAHLSCLLFRSVLMKIKRRFWPQIAEQLQQSNRKRLQFHWRNCNNFYHRKNIQNVCEIYRSWL